MEIIKTTDITSTNDYLLSSCEHGYEDAEICLVADYQHHGRGMGTNTWESEPGKNLLFSILLHPHWLLITKQYLLSMAEALAIYDALITLLPDDKLKIKWPNDIYYADKKLSGTRIDVNLKGFEICDMVIGTGINVNQKKFVSSAPNPISLIQITGKEHNQNVILRDILTRLEHYIDMVRRGDDEMIINIYKSHLYRADGFYPYKDSNGLFLAEIVDIAADGTLTLRRKDDTLSHYQFKEVETIIQ